MSSVLGVWYNAKDSDIELKYMLKIIKMCIFLVAIVLTSYYLTTNTQDYKEIIQTKEKQPASVSTNKLSTKIAGEEYAYSWIRISNTDSLFLIPNFQENYTAEEAVSKHVCNNLTSGGFYTETNSPIGLFISEAEKLGDDVHNTLFNGYFTLTKNGVAAITKYYSGEPVRIGLQAGPMLLSDGVVQKLSLKSDKMARRNIVALTKDNEIFFITIYNNESVFVGPLLSNLPELVSVIQNELNIKFDSALNLDGGSASAFYTQEMHFSELTPVGSFFCEK